MLNLNSIMLGSEHPKELAEFYGKIFDAKPTMQDGDWTGYMVGTVFFAIGAHDKVKGKNSNPERLMFNIETKEVKAEFERMKKVGATVIKEPYSMTNEGVEAWIATLADPDGNYFQLMTPWEG